MRVSGWVHGRLLLWPTFFRQRLFFLSNRLVQYVRATSLRRLLH